MERNGVFISYSKKDIKWLRYLRTHLSYLERNYQFTIWEDSKIAIGADWRQEINNAIGQTQIAILMVSPNFIASEFIANEELPALLDAAKAEGAVIFSIIVSHCMFSDIEAISRFQSINPPTNPLIEMNEGERDALFLKVTQEIKQVLSRNQKTNIKLNKKQEITPLYPWELSFMRVLILKTFYNKKEKQGITIKEIQLLGVIKKRKNTVQLIHELEKLQLLTKTKVNNNTYYKLSDKGEEFIANFKNTLF